MVFVPANNTYHGFEKRPIKGVRTSLIINYVTNEWRAREQLVLPRDADCLSRRHTGQKFVMPGLGRASTFWHNEDWIAGQARP